MIDVPTPIADRRDPRDARHEARDVTPLEFRYGPHRAQTATMHLPARPRPPVVCLLHGGFWTMPHGADQMASLADDLARRGHAAWNLEYRRLGDGGGFPATFDDVVDGIAYLSATGLSIDLTRVVAVGHSAGGHLALWAASQARLALRAACGQAPVTDLAEAWRLGLGNGVVERLMGGSPRSVPARYVAGSPATRGSTVRSRLIVHGEDDDVVPISSSRAFAAASEDTTLRSIAGCGHFEHLDPSSAAWREVADWIDGLFDGSGGSASPAAAASESEHPA